MVRPSSKQSSSASLEDAHDALLPSFKEACCSIALIISISLLLAFLHAVKNTYGHTSIGRESGCGRQVIVAARNAAAKALKRFINLLWLVRRWKGGETEEGRACRC